MKTNQEIIEYCNKEININEKSRIRYFNINNNGFHNGKCEGRKEAYQEIINFINEKGENEQNT